MSTRRKDLDPAELPAEKGGSLMGVAPHGGARRRPAASVGSLDQLEAVALVARSRRGLLLKAHRERLGKEDLEDCYSQATLELLARARRGQAPFHSARHIAHALEQKLVSRIKDRRRAISGRSPIEAALFRARPLEDQDRNLDTIDRRADVELLVMLRHDLRRIGELAGRLTSDQRLVLCSQLALEMAPSDFCDRHGWTLEKYRKVAQRARARLWRLLDEPLPPTAARAGTPGSRRGAEREAGGDVEISQLQVSRLRGSAG